MSTEGKNVLEPSKETCLSIFQSNHTEELNSWNIALNVNIFGCNARSKCMDIHSVWNECASPHHDSNENYRKCIYLII